MANPGVILHERYRLDQKIGDGGFAQVYKATDLTLGRTVAVKIMDTDLTGEQGLFERFQREARAIAALDHPNIIAIHDFGLLHDSAFLVMPYVAGGPLSNRLHTTRLSLEGVANYLEQLATALDYAHSHGIVHRDVKPANILLRPDNRIILTDFGFAKFVEDSKEGAFTQALGTVHYMSPEQIYGRVSAASDQYSLGVVLYQMVAGVLPFDGNSRDVLVAHVEQTPPLLSQQITTRHFSPSVLAQLDKVMARVLAKQENARYPNCTEFSLAYRMATQTGLPYLAPPTIQPPLASPAAVTPQPAQITVRTEPDRGLKLSFDLKAPTLTIGRSSDNSIYIPLATISRQHAILQRLEPEGKYKIVDNKSRNGLLYKGKFILEKILENGDVIEIGKPGHSDYVVFLTYTAPQFS